MTTVTLYRPVGPKELELIEASGWKRFPPRLPEQPIFYPVLNEEYAAKIAREWNVKESGVGVVTRFAVDAEFLRRYPVHTVGPAICQELWVPAEDLDEFNDHIEGLIEVVHEFRTHSRQHSDGRPLRLDPDARSADPNLPAFLARPADAPVYHGFPLIEESRIDGWCFGLISDCNDPGGCEWGDAFVVAPDGSRAGIAWSVGRFPMKQICAPDDRRWGVYAVALDQPVRTTQELVRGLLVLLPELKAIYERLRGR